MNAEALKHPAAGEELAHLNETLETIDRETVIAEEALNRATAELNAARRSDPDMLPLREMMCAAARQTAASLRRAAEKPYFTRVDFRETGREPETHYIGKQGVMRSDTLEPEVVDWRAPVANLYYAGQIGEISYEAPDGRVEGELLLKRQFGIEGGALKTIFDADLVSQDEYLQSVLGAMTGDRLKEIVTTIQAEQNYVIRYPLSRNLIVQGVAGSGKTTIALHRIAYLLYAYQKQLRAEHVMILAPSPLFLSYIAGVLPELGVEQVKQSTFEQWSRGYLGGYLPGFLALSDTAELMDAPEDERRRAAEIARRKGSAELEARIDRWFAAWEKAFTPKDGLSFGPVRLYTHDEMERFLLVDEKPFPMSRRVEEFAKQLKLRVSTAAARISEWYRQETEKRAAAIRASEPSPAKRRERLAALERSLSERLRAVEKQKQAYVKKTLEELPSTEPMALFDQFWKDMRDGSDEEMRACAEDYLARREARLPLTREDVAPLILLARRAVPLPRQEVRHIVIDEAQDFSPLEIRALQAVCRNATFTIVGDLMQGIYGWRGIEDWAEISEGVFGGKAVRHFLAVSYRNTIEIMTLARRIAESRPARDGVRIKPVLRHGEAPAWIRADGIEERAARTAELLRRWRAEGLSSVAVICRSGDVLRRLLEAMPAGLGAKEMDTEEEGYDGGVRFARATQVKGLEFDGVILADADDYADADEDARLLYVAVTRALHRLAILHGNGKGALLSRVSGD